MIWVSGEYKNGQDTRHFPLFGTILTNLTYKIVKGWISLVQSNTILNPGCEIFDIEKPPHSGGGFSGIQFLKLYQHCPNNIQIITKTIIVPKQPPPNFFAPMPAINPLKILFIVLCFFLCRLCIYCISCCHCWLFISRFLFIESSVRQ